MIEILCFLIAAAASLMGALSGIGGGVIIKPVMDSVNIFSVHTVNFLSGCTVLTMAAANYIRGLKHRTQMNYSVSFFLAIGSAIGGIAGKQVFVGITGNLALIQAILLLLINVFVLIFVLKKHSISTLRIKNRSACLGIGFFLGIISAFLGIGGGPLNIAVLFYFFSMPPKETARNSLFIILFSQMTSLATNIFTRTIPEFPLQILVLMCVGGIVGAFVGSDLSEKADEMRVEKFFFILLIVLIGINVYNVIKCI